MSDLIEFRPVVRSAALSDEQVATLLNVCQEYSHYWIWLLEPVSLAQFKTFMKSDIPLQKEWGSYATYCLYEGSNNCPHELRFHIDEEKPAYLSPIKIAQGIDIFVKEWSGDYKAVMEGNDDAETADIFLQVCLFGEVIYG